MIVDTNPCQFISISIEIDDYILFRDRERRNIKAPNRYGYVYMISYALHAAEEVISDEHKS